MAILAFIWRVEHLAVYIYGFEFTIQFMTICGKILLVCLNIILAVKRDVKKD